MRLRTSPDMTPSPTGLWNLRILPYVANELTLLCIGKYVIKLRTRRAKIFPGLSEWAQNAITCILVRQTHRRGQREEEEAVGPTRQREWSDAAPRQETTTATRSWTRSRMV